MKKLTIHRIAVASKGYNGLKDTVSDNFGKAPTFTIVDVENEKIKSTQTIINPASNYEHGSGPIASRKLAELNVNLVIASQLGPGALEILKYHNISSKLASSNSPVEECIKGAIIETAFRDSQ